MVSQELNVLVDSLKSVESQFNPSSLLISSKPLLEDKPLKCQKFIQAYY